MIGSTVMSRETRHPRKGPPASLARTLVASTLVLTAPGAVLAQEAIFADDFSADSLSWTTQSFDDSGPASARGEPGAIVMEARGSVEREAYRILRLPRVSDTLSVTASLDPSSAIGDGVDSQADLNLVGRLFNDTLDGGDPDDRESGFEGDVVFNLSAAVNGDGSSAVSFCIGRETVSGLEPYPAFADGENCTLFEDATIALGTPLTFGYALDRTSGELAIDLNGQTLTATLAGPFLASSDPQTSIEIVARGDTFAVARITAIDTEDRTVDFAGTTPIVDRYQPFFFDVNNPGSARVENGRARLFAVSANGDYSSTDLRPGQPTDYFEAVLTLSSESAFSDGSIDARLESEWFNDTADGGTDGRTGEVRAIVSLRAQANGQRNVEYCLIRSDDADFDAQSGLLDDGETCATFPTRIELDTPYRVSLALDRDAATVTYRFAGFEHVQSIAGGVFAGADPRSDARVSADDGASGIAFVDDLRTAPLALTDAESAAGITAPAPFPEPTDPAELAADETLSAPYDFERRLSFVDDFSAPESTALGFWSGARDGRGEGGIRVVDGALELQANSRGNDDPDGGNFSEIYVNGGSDTLRARVSLRSDSVLPPDPRAEAEIALRAVFHNDLQDGGANEREGDVAVSVTLRQEGDGRLRASAGTDRRDADGRNERYDIIDGDDFFAFDPVVPFLDAIHELSLSLDRERGALVVTVDEQRLDIPLPGAVFEPAQAFTLVQVSHRGSSGRAIGRIHSIETDTFRRDFADGPGVLGPYAPGFNLRAPGRSVTVVDGRARFVTDARLSSGNDSRLFVAGGSDFVGADVTLSSESMLAAGGTMQIGVGASLYNDLAAGSGSEGRVYAEMWINATAEGERFGEYCAFRSNDADFSDTVELIAGRDEDCARFDLPIALDTAYPMSLRIDRARSALVYTLGGETREYAIPTAVFAIERPFNSVNLRASDGSSAVGYVDNLALDESPVPLASSDQRLGAAGGGVAPDGDTDPVDAGTDDSTGGGGGGGGGGCSIGGDARGSTTMTLLLAIGVVGIARRRRRRAALSRVG